jgi:hypothetical protein
MQSIIWLVHANPVTKAHEQIIREKMQRGDVYVFPVIFKRNNEVNTRSLPFNFEVRREMLQTIFQDRIHISDAYTFHEPYKEYLGRTIVGIPVAFSAKAYRLRDAIISEVPEPRKSYTGNYSEYLLLKKFGLNPERGERKPVAATNVRELMYKEALGEQVEDWRDFVPGEIVGIIEKHWDVVRHFAGMEDRTIRKFGMKIPMDGFK